PRGDDDDDPGNARRRELRDDQLDDGRVDQREELLRHDAADRQESRAEAARGNDAAADRPEAVRAGRHQRASALTVNATGWGGRGRRRPGQGPRPGASRTHAGAAVPPGPPVMPLPRFCPFGSVLVDASVRSGTQWAPASVEAST